MMETVTVRAAADRSSLAALTPTLSRLLIDCVADGASVGFLHPLSQDRAEAFWRAETGPAVLAGGRVLLIAERAGAVVGAGQLDCAKPDSHPHRAEVMKLLVDPRARRRGVGRALMIALEDAARARGRWLLTLDTASPDKAEPLYRALGYQRAGAIPEYAKDPIANRFDATVFYWKKL